MCKDNDFEPLTGGLWHGQSLTLASRAGRSSDPYLPFFNVQLGEAGVIVALGWTGGWQAEFTRRGGGCGQAPDHPRGDEADAPQAAGG